MRVDAAVVPKPIVVRRFRIITHGCSGPDALGAPAGALGGATSPWPPAFSDDLPSLPVFPLVFLVLRAAGAALFLLIASGTFGATPGTAQPAAFPAEGHALRLAVGAAYQGALDPRLSDLPYAGITPAYALTYRHPLAGRYGGALTLAFAHGTLRRDAIALGEQLRVQPSRDVFSARLSHRTHRRWGAAGTDRLRFSAGLQANAAATFAQHQYATGLRSAAVEWAGWLALSASARLPLTPGLAAEADVALPAVGLVARSRPAASSWDRPERPLLPPDLLGAEAQAALTWAPAAGYALAVGYAVRYLQLRARRTTQRLAHGFRLTGRIRL
jgi:hypothetical protein